MIKLIGIFAFISSNFSPSHHGYNQMLFLLSHLFSVCPPGPPGMAGCGCGRGCGRDSAPPHSDPPAPCPSPSRAGWCWKIITCCQYILSCDRVSIGMLSNLWNVIWCIDIVICKNQISNKYFHKKWHSPDQSFPAAAQHSSEMKQRQFWEIFYSALHLYQERCQNDSYQSSGSQSLNPLANGLLAIFNWVIWKMRQWCSVYIKDR